MTVGVLGGMGPDATVDFMAKVVAATPAQTDADHIRMLVDHNPLVPSRQAAILGDGTDPGVVMAQMALGLQASGAEFLVMPCNTAHAFAQSIEEAVDIPLLSIIDVTVAACRAYDKVGLLATDGCLKSRVYDEAFARQGIELVPMTSSELVELTDLIAVIKTGELGAAVGERMRALATALLGRGADAVVAGCTEIPLVLEPASLDGPLVSSTDELVKATVARAQKTR